MTFTQAMDAAAVQIAEAAQRIPDVGHIEDRMKVATLWMQYASQIEFHERSAGAMSGWQAQVLSAQAQEHIRKTVEQAGTQEDAS